MDAQTDGQTERHTDSMKTVYPTTKFVGGTTVCKQWWPWSDAAFAASDLGLHCLQITLLGVCKLK